MAQPAFITDTNPENDHKTNWLEEKDPVFRPSNPPPGRRHIHPPPHRLKTPLDQTGGKAGFEDPQAPGGDRIHLNIKCKR